MTDSHEEDLAQIEPRNINNSINKFGSHTAEILNAENFSIMNALGGVRGVIEGVAPGLVFVVGYVLTRDLFYPLIGSCLIALIFIALRIFVHKSSALQAVSGMLGVFIGVVWAYFSGKGEDFFAYSLWINLLYFSVLLISVLVRWPLIGVLMGFARSQGTTWRTNMELKAQRHSYYAVTILWVLLFGLRLAIKLPLYLQAQVALLGTVHLIMGVPFTALCLWFSWLLLRRSHHSL